MMQDRSIYELSLDIMHFEKEKTYSRLWPLKAIKYFLYYLICCKFSEKFHWIL